MPEPVFLFQSYFGFVASVHIVPKQNSFGWNIWRSGCQFEVLPGYARMFIESDIRYMKQTRQFIRRKNHLFPCEPLIKTPAEISENKIGDKSFITVPVSVFQTVCMSGRIL